MGPLCLIGDAVLEVIGLNPTSFETKATGNWPATDVFAGEPLVQPTGLGEETTTMKLAARPHVMGGLANYEALRGMRRSQAAVPFIRLGAAMVGEVVGQVGVRSLSSTEEKLAPDGRGRRWEFEVELIHLGRGGAGSF